jgi:DNA repair exonuclease SbcCD ATPase subunit
MIIAMPLWSLKKRKAERKKIASVNNTTKKILANSDHTQSTLSTTTTDTLKEFEDIIEHEVTSFPQKEDERIRLRQEINECQEQLSMLHSMVKQLEVDMEEAKPTLSSCSKDDEKSSLDSDEYQEEEEEEWSQKCVQPSEDDETILTFYAHDAGSQHALQSGRNSEHSRIRQSEAIWS